MESKLSSQSVFDVSQSRWTERRQKSLDCIRLKTSAIDFGSAISVLFLFISSKKQDLYSETLTQKHRELSSKRRHMISNLFVI